MPTQTKENYLKAAYFLAQKGSDITITDLSKMMEVSTPTVNNMVKKMEKKGWVIYQKYKPILLTDLGNKEAALIVRKHRLTEMFLTQIMGFGWEEVHEIAEEMEHLPTESLFDRMDEILGFPTTDPHGSPIPNKEGVVAIKELINLSELKENTKAKLAAVGDSSVELLMLLNEKGIKLGTEFLIVKVESFDQSMTVDYNQHQGVTLSYQVCSRLRVELV